MWLEEFLRLLNVNSGAFSVVFSFIVSVATVIYAILTWKLVSETRKTRELQTRPNVFIVLQPREEWINFMDIIIQNVGPGAAWALKFEVVGDIENNLVKELLSIGFIRNGLRYLAPGQRIQSFIGTFPFQDEDKKDSPGSFTIIVSYKDSMGKEYKDIYELNLAAFLGIKQLESNFSQLQRDIRDLTKAVQHIVSECYYRRNL